MYCSLYAPYLKDVLKMFPFGSLSHVTSYKHPRGMDTNFGVPDRNVRRKNAKSIYGNTFEHSRRKAEKKIR